MSLKCSIFGHKYTEPDVERERDEQGSEVVITIRELESCGRCGHTRVVSENKEVTTLETPDVAAEGATDDAPSADGSDAGGGPAAGPAGDPGGAEAVERSPEGAVADATDAEFVDEEPVGESESGPAGDETDEAAESGGDHHPADEVIQEAPGGGAPADDAEGADAGGDQTADDGVILESEDAGAAETEGRQPGEWPQDSGDEPEPDWVTETEHTAPTYEEGGPEIESAGSAVTVPEGEFVCGECAFTTAVESSSLRAGDFCPECQQGTLQHRPSGD